MSLNRNEKPSLRKWLPKRVKSQTLALAEYRGLTVAQLDQLRKNARAQGVYLHVLKNTLARRCCWHQFEVAAESMSGPLIYGFSEDAVAAAKVIADFAKGNDKLVIKAGAYAGRLWTPMASSPWPRSQARKFWPNCVACSNAPVSGFARVLAAVAEQRVAAPKRQPKPLLLEATFVLNSTSNRF